ncbi:MAG TPA: ATP-binding protein [Puia sp.]|jgi:signal transduction histidine kinase
MSIFKKGLFKTSLLHQWWQRIGEIGLSSDMPAYQYRRGYAYNQMNFAGLCLSLSRLGFMAFVVRSYSAWDLFVNSLPAIFCGLMAVWMAYRVYSMTKLFSFFLFPVLLFYIIVQVHDRGVVAYFIPYLIYPFFFLHNRRKILITFSVAAICFAASFAVEVFHIFNPLHRHNPPLEMISVLGSLILTFFSLFAIKYQVWMYEKTILQQAAELEVRNASIRRQNRVMVHQKDKLEETNRTKDKLFSIISHDLRVPIEGLQLLFASEANTKESLVKLEENLPELRAELKKTSALFKNLLDWAKVQMRETAVRAQPVNLQEMILQVTEQLHDKICGKGVVIDVSVPPEPINSDKNILEIVIRNILSNAIKFSGAGAPIFIRGQFEEEQFVLEIEDRGVGIDAVCLQRIQNKSFHTSPGTGQEKGTGLGLIICEDLIEKCGGRMVIESEPGKGTVVRIELEEAAVEAMAPAADAARETENAAKEAMLPQEDLHSDTIQKVGSTHREAAQEPVPPPMGPPYSIRIA